MEFCQAVSEGLCEVREDLEILHLPLADGGDGTIDVVQFYLGGQVVNVQVNDPLFRIINSSYIYSEDKRIAYIEMATASGLRLLQDHEINCMNTTSLGTGELIKDAISRGANQIILGIGGSATNDAGMGMASALGYEFINDVGQNIKPVGRELINLRSIKRKDVVPKLDEIVFKTACDVKNALHGPNGAAFVYAEQKGASQEEIMQLDSGLKNFAAVVQKQYAIDVQKIEGAGAAGGLGAASIVFLNAELVPGIELLKNLASFDNVIKDADWIITGEGKLDEQTLSGKTINGVLTSARTLNTPVAAFCGSVHLPKEAAKNSGLAYVVGVSEREPDLATAMKNSYKNVKRAAKEFAQQIL